MVDVDLLLDQLADLVAVRLAPLLAAPPAAESWRLLSLEQAAEALGRSSRWVRQRVKRGELPYVRLDGGGFAFEVEDLRAFARAHRVDGLEVCAGRVQASRDPASGNGSRAADRVGYRRGDVPRARRRVRGVATCVFGE